MRILHLCLSCVFIDNHAYQENELVKEHHRLGHEVLIIANTGIHGRDGRRGFTISGTYEAIPGVPLIRIPYHPALPHRLAKSLRIHRGLYGMVADFRPDVIYFHGLSGWATGNGGTLCPLPPGGTSLYRQPY